MKSTVTSGVRGRVWTTYAELHALANEYQREKVRNVAPLHGTDACLTEAVTDHGSTLLLQLQSSRNEPHGTWVLSKRFSNVATDFANDQMILAGCDCKSDRKISNLHDASNLLQRGAFNALQVTAKWRNFPRRYALRIAWIEQTSHPCFPGRSCAWPATYEIGPPSFLNPCRADCRWKKGHLSLRHALKSFRRSGCAQVPSCIPGQVTSHDSFRVDPP